MVDRGLITALGVDVEPPAGAWVIEGAGLTVYPGLIDGLASLPLVMPPRPTGNDAPIARGPEDRPATTPWLRAADLLDSSSLDKWRQRRVRRRRGGAARRAGRRDRRRW